MNKISLDEIKTHLEFGGKLICTSVEGKFTVYTYDIDKIESIDVYEEDDTILIINGIKVKLLYISNKNSVGKIDKVVKTDNNKNIVNIFIETDGFEDKIESLASKVILVIRLLSVLSNKQLTIILIRYQPDTLEKDMEEYENTTGTCIWVCKNMTTNPVLYLEPRKKDTIVTPYRLFLYVIKEMKEKLNVPRTISYNRVYKVLMDYLNGRYSNDNFDIWSSVYSSYYKLKLDNEPFGIPEILTTDDNTKVIIAYLVSRYRIDKYKRVSLEDTIFHPDIKVIGSAKYKADKFLEKIKKNHVKAISYREGTYNPKVVSTILLDYNGILSDEDKLTYAKLYIPVITLTKHKSNVDIVVSVINTGIMSYIASSSILHKVKQTIQAKNVTIEYKLIK